MATWWRRRRHRRPMSTCTFPTLRSVSRATPGASASDSPRHHWNHHHHYHCQQPVKGGRGDILRNYHLLSYLLLGPGELASRLRDEVAEAEAEWEPIDKAGDSVLRRRLNITLGTNFLLGFLPVKAMLFSILIWPGNPATGSCVGKVADGRPVVRTLWTRPWSPAAVRATTQRVITQLEL